ncbi:MAG: hypothetical protein Q4E88_00275 [Coriobacteriia bacterium]|nr:hypothetical protein [Coriobacteriia bacterium]
MSIGCDFPFGSYYHRTSTDVKAFYYSTEGEIWTTKDISTAQSVVLAKEFGGPEKPQLKSLILKEIIGGVKQNVQYFPIAGDSLGENIKFYDANLNPLQKTGADGKYKQSDLTRAVLYTGDGSFKTLRSILESWDNTFDLEGESSGLAQKIKDTFKANHLVGGNEDTEQVYRFNGDKHHTRISPTYEGVSLTEIWNTYKSAGFCGSHGRLWSASAENVADARVWDSHEMQWFLADRDDPDYYYVLACREFNSALH